MTSKAPCLNDVGAVAAVAGRVEAARPAAAVASRLRRVSAVMARSSGGFLPLNSKIPRRRARDLQASLISGSEISANSIRPLVVVLCGLFWGRLSGLGCV